LEFDDVQVEPALAENGASADSNFETSSVDYPFVEIVYVQAPYVVAEKTRTKKAKKIKPARRKR
jgi:hypothetical protein